MASPSNVSDPWFPWPPDVGGAPLVCCAHAGGGAIAYRGWGERLGERVQVWTAERAGRGTRIKEPAATTLAQIADGLAGAVEARIEGPVSLFGHSMGAAVAFEVARRIEDRRGAGSVRCLVAAGSWPPGQRRVRPQPLHTLDDQSLMRALAAFGGTPVEVLARDDLMNLLVPAVRADLRAHYDYAPAAGATLAAPIAVLLGRDDAEVDPVAAQGWAEFTRGPCDVELFPGGHFFVRSAADQVLARVAALVESDEGGGSR